MGSISHDIFVARFTVIADCVSWPLPSFSLPYTSPFYVCLSSPRARLEYCSSHDFSGRFRGLTLKTLRIINVVLPGMLDSLLAQ